MKQLGFPLAQINEALHNPRFSIRDATRDLRAELHRRRQEIDELDARLAKYEDAALKGTDASPDTLLRLIEKLNLLERFIASEDKEIIREHDEKMGP